VHSILLFIFSAQQQQYQQYLSALNQFNQTGNAASVAAGYGSGVLDAASNYAATYQGNNALKTFFYLFRRAKCAQ
jgi:hypothetical protein